VITRETGCVEATVPKSISVSEMTNPNNGGVSRGISFASGVQTVVINGETASARATKNTTPPTSFSNRSRITFFLLFVNTLLHQEDGGKKGDVHFALLDGKRLLQDAGAHVRQEPLADIQAVREFGEGLPEPEVPGVVAEMEFDVMRHFIGSKKTRPGSSRPLTAAHGEPWPGRSAVVILQRSGGSTKR